MNRTFKADEIVNFAINIEINGKEFYKTVAAMLKKSAVKEAFLWLAGEEEKHMKIFEEMYSELDSHVQPESHPGEYGEYVRALVKENVFTKNNMVKEMVSKSITAAPALQLALKFEKDTILFFIEMKNFVPVSQQKTIDNLIEEEKKHINKIVSLNKI